MNQLNDYDDAIKLYISLPYLRNVRNSSIEAVLRNLREIFERKYS